MLPKRKMLMCKPSVTNLLVEKEVVSQQQYEQFRTNAEALDATVLADKAAIDNANAAARASQEAVENAKAAVLADRATLENAKIQLGYCSICSPIDGRTGNLLIHQGNIVKANDTSLSGCHQPDQSHLCNLFSS